MKNKKNKKRAIYKKQKFPIYKHPPPPPSIRDTMLLGLTDIYVNLLLELSSYTSSSKIQGNTYDHYLYHMVFLLETSEVLPDYIY